MRFIAIMFVMLMAAVSPSIAAVNHLGAAGSSEILNWDLAIVRIDRQCQADPPVISIDANDGSWSPEKRYQVLWIADKIDGDLVIITPKGPREQDAANPRRGLVIAGLFKRGYWIPGSSNAVTSGVPKVSTGLGSVAWRYDIEIRDAQGNVICRVDPVICIKPGGVVMKDTCD
ncbi:MAG: hypothetical protein ACJ76Y_11325 [Thermoanaerobaculia bacterium]